MTVKTASQRGRAAVAKGKENERKIANTIKPYWPDAHRARDNGSAWTLDEGDIAGTGPALFWSCKDDAKGDMGKPSVIAEWLDDCWTKAGPHRIPILVQKRRGYADPLDYWCWLRMSDLVDLAEHDLDLGSYASNRAVAWDAPVRLLFRDVLALLQAANYTHTNPAAA